MTGFGWFAIARLGLVQAAIGAIVMLATSLLNRVMVVEYALPAALPAGLVAWHYAVQLSRPVWGHGSDRGRRRTPWIMLGMVVLAGGVLLAAGLVPWLGQRDWRGFVLAALAFTLIGGGVGAAGTSLLAMLATGVQPQRRAGAAALTYTMMIAGIVVTAGVAGRLLEPFSLPRLLAVVAGVCGAAVAVSLLALVRLEPRGGRPVEADVMQQGFGAAVAELWADLAARRFTVFVFCSMLAYSMQDLILEPFAGLRFGFTPGQSTQLSGTQHAGILVGMILTGIGGSAFGGRDPAALRRWILGGCHGSALMLAGLAVAAQVGPGWPLSVNVALLGFANGVFTIAAIGAMMGLAGAGGPRREGVRMGVWGAAQAIAFGCGGLLGALLVDVLRAVLRIDPPAFAITFALEGSLFLLAAWLAVAATARAGAYIR